MTLACQATAQTFTTLYSVIPSEGAFPSGELVLSGNTLYGTAGAGSANECAVFAVNTYGTGFTTLYSFTDETTNGINSDGAGPSGGLVLSGNTLYGTASGGGTSGCGTIFAVNTNGAGFTTLYDFTDSSDGANPQAGLILSGNTLYGTAEIGGSSDWGTVFAVNTDGTGFTTLYSFTDGSDGGHPAAKLVLSGNTLYGTAVMLAAVRFVARCSLSIRMARVLQPCIALLAAATVVIRVPDWFYQMAFCMGRRSTAVVRGMVRCLPSTPMAPVLRPCIALLTVATEAVLLPDWFCREAPYMGQRR